MTTDINTTKYYAEDIDFIRNSENVKDLTVTITLQEYRGLIGGIAVRNYQDDAEYNQRISADVFKNIMVDVIPKSCTLLSCSCCVRYDKFNNKCQEVK